MVLLVFLYFQFLNIKVLSYQYLTEPQLFLQFIKIQHNPLYSLWQDFRNPLADQLPNPFQNLQLVYRGMHQFDQFLILFFMLKPQKEMQECTFSVETSLLVQFKMLLYQPIMKMLLSLQNIILFIKGYQISMVVLLLHMLN